METVYILNSWWVYFLPCGGGLAGDACEYGQGLSPAPQKSSCQRPSVTCEQRMWIWLRFCKALVGADIDAVLSWSLPARQGEKFTTSPESERNVDPCYLFYVYTSVYLLEYCYWTPWTAARQASLSFTISRNLLKLISIEAVMPSSHLILCHLLLLLPSVFPSIRVFSSESALHIRWPKYWSFSFSISPCSEYSGLIPSRSDWSGLISLIHLYILTPFYRGKAEI